MQLGYLVGFDGICKKIGLVTALNGVTCVTIVFNWKLAFSKTYQLQIESFG